MTIAKFMTPADRVVSCYPSDTIKFALEQTIKHPDVGAVVVLHPTGGKHIPVGIVTKTDLLQAYLDKLDLDNLVETVMGHKIETVLDTKTRDDAATHFEKTKHHHAFVVNSDQQWVGLVAAWDVATELARDSRAWPWNRDAVEAIEKHYTHSPKTRHKVAAIPKDPTHPDYERHSFLDIAGAND